jgi:hypothetical protein
MPAANRGGYTYSKPRNKPHQQINSGTVCVCVCVCVCACGAGFRVSGPTKSRISISDDPIRIGSIYMDIAQFKSGQVKSR